MEVNRPMEGHVSTESAGGIRTFLIADVRNYTLFTLERGDEAATKLAARFASLARRGVEGRGGELVELRGDEALAVFSSSRQAIRAAIELQRQFLEETIADPSLPLPVGIGIDVGEAVPLEGGYRGRALNQAARLCGLAQAGESLASREAVHLAGRIEGVLYRDRGDVHLKGFPDPVRVVAVVPEGEDLVSRLAPFLPPRPKRTAQRAARLLLLGARRHRPMAVLISSLVALSLIVGVSFLTRRGETPTGIAPPPADRLVRIDPATNGVAMFAVGLQPSAVAFGKGSVWITTVKDRTLSRMDARTGRVEARISLGGLPTAVAFGDGGDGHQDVWVVSKLDGSVSRVDANTNSVVATIPVGQGINELGVGAGGIWVAKASSNSLWRIDPKRNQVVETFPVGPEGEGIGGLGIADRAVWVSASRVTHPPNIGPSGILTTEVLRIDPTLHKVVKKIRLFETSGGVAFGGNSPLTFSLGTLWVADASTDMVYRIDPESGQVQAQLAINSHPVGIVADGKGSVWIGTSFQRTLWRISTLSDQVIRTTELPGTPTSLAFGGGSLWLSMYGVRTGTESPQASS